MTKRLWDAEARFYRGLRRNAMSARILSEENAAAKRLLARLDFSNIHRVLDIGTGVGNALSLIEHRAMRVSAIDASAEMLREATLQFPNVKFYCADACAMPFDDAAFELVLCVGVSEYVSDMSLLFQEIYRVLAPSGYALLTAASASPFNLLRYVLGHRLFLRRRLDGVAVQSGFDILDDSRTLLQIQYLLQKS